jgi:hypothetical protein
MTEDAASNAELLREVLARLDDLSHRLGAIEARFEKADFENEMGAAAREGQEAALDAG